MITDLCMETDINNLPSNVSKCDVVTYTHQRNPILVSYTIPNSKLNILRVNEIKDLGTLFDKQLTFKEYSINS